MTELEKLQAYVEALTCRLDRLAVDLMGVADRQAEIETAIREIADAQLMARRICAAAGQALEGLGELPAHTSVVTAVPTSTAGSSRP